MISKVLFIAMLFFSLLGFSQSELTYKENYNPDGVGLYTKAEIGVKLPNEIEEKVNEFLSDSNTGLNPYDATVIDLSSEWISPSGKVQKVNGFFYQNFRKKNNKQWRPTPTPFQWLLRWAPDELGVWKVKITLQSEGKSWETSALSFKCTESGEDGYLTHNPEKPNGNKYLYLNDSEKPFFAIGHNVAYGGYKKLIPEHAERHRMWLKELAAGGGNFWRLEFGMNNYLPSGYNCKNYTEKLANFTELDRIVELSDDLDMHFIAFRHHVEVEDGFVWMSSRWDVNGYKTQLGLESRLDYFTKKESLKWQRNEIRYIMARWGYSTSFNFFGYSEIEGWVKDLASEFEKKDHEVMDIFTKWNVDQMNFISDNLGNKRMMYTSTYATHEITKKLLKFSKEERLKSDILLHCDMIGWHKYGKHKFSIPISRPNTSAFFHEHYNIPVIQEESGVGNPHLYCATDGEFFNTIWNSCFFGDFGTSMHYFWDRGIHYNNYQELYKPLRNFVSKIDFSQNFETQSRTNAKVNKMNLAFSALVHENGNLVYGYMHDPSYYWRNKKAELPKIQQFLDSGQMKDFCIMPDGNEVGKLRKGEKNNNTNPEFEDAYTKQADKEPMTAANYGTVNIKLKGLENTGLFSKKRKFLVEYYDPRDPNLKVVKTETVLAKRNGTISLTMDSSNWPACAFIIKSE